MKNKFIFFLTSILIGVCLPNTNHLVFSRITIAPTEAEFVSIYNPTNDTIPLSDYYITDSDLYYNLPSGENFWNENQGQTLQDFLARFPDVSIFPNDSLTLSFQEDSVFNSYYTFDPENELAIIYFSQFLPFNDETSFSLYKKFEEKIYSEIN